MYGREQALVAIVRGKMWFGESVERRALFNYTAAHAGAVRGRESDGALYSIAVSGCGDSMFYITLEVLR